MLRKPGEGSVAPRTLPSALPSPRWAGASNLGRRRQLPGRLLPASRPQPVRPAAPRRSTGISRQESARYSAGTSKDERGGLTGGGSRGGRLWHAAAAAAVAHRAAPEASAAQVQQLERHRLSDSDPGEEVVQLMANDGTQFSVKWHIACQSAVLESMLRAGFREALEGRVVFPDISAQSLRDIVKYLQFCSASTDGSQLQTGNGAPSHTLAAGRHQPGVDKTDPCPCFVPSLADAVHTAVAARYLDLDDLVLTCAQAIGESISSLDSISGVPNDIVCQVSRAFSPVASRIHSHIAICIYCVYITILRHNLNTTRRMETRLASGFVLNFLVSNARLCCTVLKTVVAPLLWEP